MTNTENLAQSKILVVDDEENIRNLLCETLRLVGFKPTAAKNGNEAISWVRKEKFDIILLDVNMPFLNGFQTLERIRQSSKSMPVIMLSARSDKEDVIAGLRDGADDYIAKPFNIEEVITRIQTVLRRVQPSMGASILEVGPIVLNSETYQVKFADDLVELSKTEFRLLQFLMERPGIVVEKETLLSAIWGYDFDTSTTVVDTYISYLRKKLHRDGFDGIKTIRGIGFQLKAN